MENTVKVVGNVVFTKYDQTGKQIDRLEVPNLVVLSGKQFIASRMVSNSNVMSHIAIGTGTTTPASSDTALSTELARAELTDAVSSSNTVSYSAFFANGIGTGTLTEAGIFNSSANGNMLCRTTFPEYEKTANDSIAVSWTISLI